MNDATMAMAQPSPEVQRAIIQQEIAMYQNTRFQTEMRHRVSKKIGGTPEELKPLVDQLAKIEAALDVLQAELAALV